MTDLSYAADVLDTASNIDPDFYAIAASTVVLSAERALNSYGLEYSPSDALENEE